MKVAPCWKLWENGKKIGLGMSITEGHRRKVSGKENSRKIKSNVIGCIAARRWRECDWLRKAKRKSTWQRNLALLRKNLPLGRKHWTGFLLTFYADSTWGQSMPMYFVKLWKIIKMYKYIRFSAGTGSMEMTAYNLNQIPKLCWDPSDKVTFHLFFKSGRILLPLNHWWELTLTGI